MASTITSTSYGTFCTSNVQLEHIKKAFFTSLLITPILAGLGACLMAYPNTFLAGKIIVGISGATCTISLYTMSILGHHYRFMPNFWYTIFPGHNDRT